MVRSNWQMWAGALSDEQCDRIIDICEKYPLEEATTFSGTTVTCADLKCDGLKIRR